jgi:preprotein translocase subunit SecA
MFEFVTNIANKLMGGDANEREINKLMPLVEKVNALEPAYSELDDDAIAAKTVEFRARIEAGETLDDLLPEAFAVVREASKRTMEMRHYDCQIIGGVTLHEGKIAEMKTGEGKTLVATLAVYLNALAGKGVHVVTVNDYLAERDAEWMGTIYRFLGMTVGCILSGERDDMVKRAAYAADITYGTNNEFGFDFLRDNMKFRLEDYVQRGHSFCIIDEVDSILIDEARTPLIISGPAESSIELYYVIDKVIPQLVPELDFTVDEKSKNVILTDEGISKLEARLTVDNLFEEQNMEVLHHVNQSLKAHYIFKRDKDYVVRENKAVIVDEFTGRLMHGRRWSDGLHQAVEAKEQLTVEPESQVYASITFQNLFRMYDKLAGMTGTAATEAAEFVSIYDLDMLLVPTNRPIARIDSEDIVYKTQMDKFKAVMEDIKEKHAKKQPILVGTTSVEKSEILHRLLDRAGVPHEVLNAKNHLREALIVAQAGSPSAVTISTNMAGRGTDIRLGGNPDELARLESGAEVGEAAYEKSLAKYLPLCESNKEIVLAAGGLHIVGTERHESRRVDNQLRGRSGRQGDPGSSRFFLSLEDDLLRMFGTDKMNMWMERMGLADDEPIEHRWISHAIENAQTKVEGHHFQIRKNILEYDDVMNYQRKGVYLIRRRALGGEDIYPMVTESLECVVGDIMDECIGEGMHPEMWDVEGLRKRLQTIFATSWSDSDNEIRDESRTAIQQRLHEEASAMVEEKVEEMGQELFDSIARMLLLQLTDKLWKDHLLAIDRLRQGVGLRGYGQRNPLLEYKREAYHMFVMMAAIRDERLISGLLSYDPEAAQAPPATRPAPVIDLGALPTQISGSATAQAAPSNPAEGAETRAFAKEHGIKKNDPCPCGSEKKFKKCCRKGAKTKVTG